MSRITSWISVLAVLVVVAGCRSYGAYGTDEATYAQIQRTLERFEEDLQRAQAGQAELQAAASESPVLEVLAAQYARLIEAHEAVLDEHRQMAADLSPESTYRSLHRAFGALVAERRLLQIQYQDVLRYVYDAYAADTIATADRQWPYAVVPPYYARVGISAPTVDDVVARVTSGAAPREGFRIVAPPAAPSEGEGEPPASGH